MQTQVIVHQRTEVELPYGHVSSLPSTLQQSSQGFIQVSARQVRSTEPQCDSLIPNQD